MEAMGRGADKTLQWVSTLHSSASYNLPRMYLLSKTSLGSGGYLLNVFASLSTMNLNFTRLDYSSTPPPPSFEKTLMLGKTEGRRRRRQEMRQLDGIIDSMDLNLSKLLEMVKDSPWGHKE